MNYAEHIDALVREHNVRHSHVAKIEDSYAQPIYRTMFTPPIEDELSYFAALHELGHIVGQHLGNPTGRYGWAREALRQEGEAWRFALDTAMHEPSREVAKTALSYLLTYWQHRDFGIHRSPAAYAGIRRALTDFSRTKRATAKYEQLALAV